MQLLFFVSQQFHYAAVFPVALFFCAPFVLSLLAYIFFLKRPCGHVSFWSFVLDKLPAE